MRYISIFKSLILTGLILSVFILKGFCQEIPHLQKNGSAKQLTVDGKPFLILGGELYNSSSSNLTYLETIWSPLKQMNLNTALVAVSWQLLEPQEGEFDFSLVDGILKGAREQQLKVILLWFGSWKNGLSHYAPLWVKQDIKRFPRIVLENGKSTETISALSKEAAQADANAFVALMSHIKEVDSKEHTVIMVQIENEVGVIGGTRDHSAMANAEFAQPIPKELLAGLQENKNDLQPSLKKLWETYGSKNSGTWTQVFGNTPSADEAFMAWNYAQYINKIALAGKAVYNIPMFVNTWIVQPQDKKPGDYPSGGPQAHVHDIWHIGAPEIDFQSPDIYLPNFKSIVSIYHHSWNPLFIPESFSWINGAANAFYAIGQHQGMGYSPFGIDNKSEEPSKTPLAKAYKIIAQLSPEILEAQAKGSIKGVSLDSLQTTQTLELGGYKLLISLRKNWNGVIQSYKGYGLIINTAENEFTVAGADLDVVFIPLSTGPKMAGLDTVYEGEYINGIWKQGRLLNGDDIMMSYKLAEEAAMNKTGTGARLNTDPSILKVKLYRYQ